MNKNKKAISAIVATVLIILITVAAVTVIWAAVLPMITGKLESSQVCSEAVSQVRLLDEGYTCRSSDGNNVSIQIKHLAKEFDLADVQVLVSSGGDSTTFELSNATTTLVPTGANIPFPGINEEKVYIINTSLISGTIEEVQIAPVVAIGNSEKTCDAVFPQTLRDC
jgi:FlaG/FlaF family flagellin (archaellin)